MRYAGLGLHKYTGELDKYLPQMASNLAKLLSKFQGNIANRYLRLNARQLKDLAGVLVDFAADVHTNTGIWNCYERYNIELFGTILALTLEHNRQNHFKGIHFERTRHLIWVLYRAFTDIPNIPPSNEDISKIAEVTQDFLSKNFALLSGDYSVKKFLNTSNNYGWDIKRKLVWLGTESYMFRTFFQKYIREQKARPSDIGHIDDFICQECTLWSGLGVIDIMAGVLDIRADNRRDLRNWCERYFAPYLIISSDSEVSVAQNTVNGRKYHIRLNMAKNPFVPGMLVLGSLTPWRGEWYWSGLQRTVGKPTPELIDELNDKMRRQNPKIICRYDKDYEMLARKHADKLYADAIAFYGSDLKIYPDGVSMAADWQKELKAPWDSKSPEEIRQAVEKHGTKNGLPDISVPKELLRCKNGIGVFLNPDGGKEIMQNFNCLQSAFSRKRVHLTEDEKEAMMDFLCSDIISPAFVKRMALEYGPDSIKYTFGITNMTKDYWLDYLLRCHKGSYFRKSYPSIAVI